MYWQKWNRDLTKEKLPRRSLKFALFRQKIFLISDTESLIQLGYVFENLKVYYGRQRTCRNWSEHVNDDCRESKAPCHFKPCIVRSWCEARRESGGYQRSREPYELWDRYKKPNEQCMYVPNVENIEIHRKSESGFYGIKHCWWNFRLLKCIETRKRPFFPLRRVQLRIWDVVLHKRHSRPPCLRVIVMWIKAVIYCLLQIIMALLVTNSSFNSFDFRLVT